MNRKVKSTGSIAAAAALAVVLFVTGCTGPGPDKAADEKTRAQQQSSKSTGETLEKKNLAEKHRREENPNQVGYVYLMNYGNVVGYYVIKGKVSSNGSQLTPEDQITYACDDGMTGCQATVVDGAQDDGSFGTKDPGIFFFTAEGVKVVTSLDYIQSDAPLPVNAPKLNATK